MTQSIMAASTRKVSYASKGTLTTLTSRSASRMISVDPQPARRKFSRFEAHPKPIPRAGLARARALLAAPLAMLLLPGCGGGDEQLAAAPAPETGGGALYAVMTNVGGPEGDTSYLATLDSLDAGNVLDVDAAIEFPGTKSVMGLSGHAAVWVTSWDEPTIERWDLSPDGSFQRGPSVSFAALGVSNTGYTSESRAFTLERAAFYSREIDALIQWNPSTMEIIDTLPLDIPDNGAIPPGDAWVQLRPDGSVLVNYHYLDANFTLGDRVGLKVVDWQANTVIGEDEWVGCNYLGRGSQTSDGTTYYTALAQWVQAALLWPGDPETAVACALRVLPGELGFDRSFQPTDLGQLIGGRTVTGSLEIVNDQRAYFVAWEDELVEQALTPENFDDLRYSTPAWKWYTWDLVSPEAREVDAEPFASQPDVLWAGERAMFRDQRLTGDRGGRGLTPMYELTAGGTLEPAFIGYGNVGSIVKTRD
jgi:hypothetical protein